MPIFRGLNQQAQRPEATSAPRQDSPPPHTPSIRPPSYGDDPDNPGDPDGNDPRSSPSPLPAKEPTQYQFDACLTYCCFKYDHVKGVALFSVLTLLVALTLIVFFTFQLVDPLVEWIEPDEAIQLLTLSSISPLVYGLLFIATLTRRRMLMLPWIVYTFLQIMFFVGIFLYKIFRSVKHKESGPDFYVIVGSSAIAIGKD